jgi:DNA-binding CsgD family transcriptional regulator
MDEIKAKTKRQTIEEMLATGKTEKEILLATNFDRSYIWTIHQKYLRAQEEGRQDA